MINCKRSKFFFSPYLQVILRQLDPYKKKDDIDRDISLAKNDIDSNISLALNDIDIDISLAKKDIDREGEFQRAERGFVIQRDKETKSGILLTLAVNKVSIQRECLCLKHF